MLDDWIRDPISIPAADYPRRPTGNRLVLRSKSSNVAYSRYAGAGRWVLDRAPAATFWRQPLVLGVGQPGEDPAGNRPDIGTLQEDFSR